MVQVCVERGAAGLQVNGSGGCGVWGGKGPRICLMQGLVLSCTCCEPLPACLPPACAGRLKRRRTPRSACTSRGARCGNGCGTPSVVSMFVDAS
jgi:hypothetical protein